MRNNQGFTLIEMLIVVAITVTLVTTSFISYQGFKDRKDVELSVSEVSSAIRDARDRSRTQENGSRWSLRLSSFENSPSNYELYSGGSYSTSSVVSSKIIRNPMTFSEPYPDGSIYDMNFEPINGSLSNQKVISITRRSGSSFLGDIIVNKFGRITERIEDGLIGYW
ncbi:MAG: prepilin-type N-terminal cleavage/methylation domain-containing protein, partial [Candidatus Paceibacterota bacterium]